MLGAGHAGPDGLGATSGSKSLSDRPVVITGAASGIGVAIARQLDAAGALVALCDLDGDRAAREASRLRRARAYGLDVRHRDDFARTLAAVETELGAVHTLINNAAVMALGPFVELPASAALHQIEVNLAGVIHGMQLALPGMLHRGEGHVVNVCSAAGRWGVPGESVYAATKHAMVGLTEVTRREVAGTGVAASLVFMGPVRGPQLSRGMKPTRAIRMVSAEAVASAVVDLLRRPGAEVWVPRSLGWMYRAGQLLPRRLREPLENLAGLGKVATDVDHRARAAYEERVFGDRGVGAELSAGSAPPRSRP